MPRSATAYPEAEFLGRASDEELVELYASARAVVVPSMEEFGITAVEAQAAGRPVIAAAAGGALETVIDGQTGLLATLDDPDSFAAGDAPDRRTSTSTLRVPARTPSASRSPPSSAGYMSRSSGSSPSGRPARLSWASEIGRNF